MRGVPPAFFLLVRGCLVRIFGLRVRGRGRPPSVLPVRERPARILFFDQGGESSVDGPEVPLHYPRSSWTTRNEPTEFVGWVEERNPTPLCSTHVRRLVSYEA